MANVAGTKATGPVSKDTVSGGKTFTPKLRAASATPKALSNSSEEARRTIMGMRVASTGFESNVEHVMTKAPK